MLLEEAIKVLDEAPNRYRITNKDFCGGFEIKYVIKEGDSYNLYLFTLGENKKLIEKNIDLKSMNSNLEWWVLPYCLRDTGEVILVNWDDGDYAFDCMFPKIGEFAKQVGYYIDKVEWVQSGVPYFEVMLTPRWNPSYKSDNNTSLQGCKYLPEIKLISHYKEKRLECQSYIHLRTYEGDDLYLGNKVDLDRVDHLYEAKKEVEKAIESFVKAFPELIYVEEKDY